MVFNLSPSSQAMCALILLPSLYLAWRLASFVSRWRSKQERLNKINAKYEMLRSVRQDAVYHYGWANSRGDFKEADGHEAHVMEIDRKLDILRQQYEAVEEHGPQVVDDVALSTFQVVSNERPKDK
mmetsp:Transcript_4447/g.6245  ORF Transcript_4447/g.6245 Transcript_4447/m.6245 type:complete len:126 (-) Transcript_4447:137-514(-)